MKVLSLLAAAAVLAAATAPATAEVVTKQFHMTALNGSGQDGTVTLLGKTDGTTIVRVRVSNPGDLAEPAHVHAGPCAKLNPKPTYPLSPLVGGISQTTIAVPLDQLLGHTLAVNVHKSSKEVSTYVSCGDLGT
jgi:hypothetical protein